MLCYGESDVGRAVGVEGEHAHSLDLGEGGGADEKDGANGEEQRVEALQDGYGDGYALRERVSQDDANGKNG